MRFYNRQHQYYCGIDLHVKTIYLCILDAAGQVLVHRNVPSTPGAFLEAVAPYRADLVVAAECMFTWYWLADLCAAEGITFVLGHALAMKAISRWQGQERQDRSHPEHPRAVQPPGLRAPPRLRRQSRGGGGACPRSQCAEERRGGPRAHRPIRCAGHGRGAHDRARGQTPRWRRLPPAAVRPGIGKILALTILYEIHDVTRFDRVQEFAS